MAERTLKLGVDSRGAERGFRRAGRASDKFNRSARGSANQTAAVTAAFRKLRNVVVGVGAALGAGRMIRGLINMNREFQRLQAQLQTVEGSLAGANAQFARIERFAVRTPFEVENLTAALVQLRVRGANPTNEEITALGDLASSFTRDITEVADAVSSATAGMTRPLRSLGFEASIAGEQITLSFQGASTTVEREAGAIVSAMSELTGDRLGGAMEREMDTINGAASNLQDSLGQLARQIGGDGGLNDEMVESIRTIDRWIQSLSEADSAVRGVGAGIISVFDHAVAAARISFNLVTALGRAVASGLSDLVGAALRVLNDYIDQVNRVPGVDIPSLQSAEDFLTGLADTLRDQVFEDLEDIGVTLNNLDMSVLDVANRLGVDMKDGAEDAAGSIDNLNDSLEDAVSNLTTLQQLRLGLLTDVSGQMDSSIPAPDVAAGPVSRRHPLNFSPAAGPGGGGGRHANLDQIDQAIRATAALADASGTLSNEARGAVRGLSDVVGGLRGLQDGGGVLGSITGVASILGGAISVFQGLSGIFESEMSENTRALRDLTGTLSGAQSLTQRRLDALDIDDPEQERAASLETLFAQLMQLDPETVSFAEGTIAEGMLGDMQAALEGSVPPMIQDLFTGTAEQVDAAIVDILDAFIAGGAEAQKLADFLEASGIGVDEFLNTISNIERLGDETDKAADAMNNMASVLNQPQGFKGIFDLLRFEATEPVAPGHILERNIGTGDLGGREDGRGLRTEPLGMRGQEVFSQVAEGNREMTAGVRQMVDLMRRGRRTDVYIGREQLIRIIEDGVRDAEDQGRITPLTSRSSIQ